MKVKSLLDLAELYSDLYAESLVLSCKLADELAEKFKDLPKEEMTKEKWEGFLEATIKRVLQKVSDVNSKTLDVLRLSIPSIMRTNFYTGVLAAQKLEEWM